MSQEAPVPPVFNGTQSENATEWIRDFKRFAIYKELTDPKKLQLLQYLLKSSAADWLDSLPNTATDSFEHLEDAFRHRFETSDLVKYRSARNIFNRRQKPLELVDDYICAVCKLGRLIEADDTMVKYAILNGLQAEIAA